MIKVIGLVKVFEDGGGGVRAVDEIEFDVAQGQLFTLLGPSGCGKTTTLRCIAGLERPLKGEIYIHNTLVFSASKNVLLPPYKRDIGMVFQSYAVWPHMTVYQNVAYPLRSRNYSRDEVKRCALEALDTVGLSALSDRPAPKLSGGQQQRVALARAIAGGPRILLFDEPLSNLDAKLREEMRGEIRRLQKRLGITALYVTHDQLEALTISDQIAIMNQGKIVEIGSPQDIYLRPRSQFAANFVGLMNVIPGKKKSRLAANEALLEMPFGQMRCVLNNYQTNGDEIHILVRPENITILLNAPPDTSNVWSGQLVEKTFLGDSLDCQVSMGGFLLRARVDPYSKVKEGDKVFVQIDASRCTTLPANGS
ncbi:MAG: ATP-binding cassette domain-containing protein [Deltaproteobacteria bacterium]|nr:ATP-binding cassette domain-containing protein [Deltaproteobacteria bacterium]